MHLLPMFMRAPPHLTAFLLQIVSVHRPAASLSAAPKTARDSGDGHGTGSEAEGGDEAADSETEGAAKRRRV
jgi:hypothetical protein